MRAKLIYEKFEEDSDPIRDLGIGSVVSCKPGDFFQCKIDRVNLKAIQRYKHYLLTRNNKDTLAWFDKEMICAVLSIINETNTKVTFVIRVYNSISDVKFSDRKVIEISLSGEKRLFAKYFKRVKI